MFPPRTSFSETLPHRVVRRCCSAVFVLRSGNPNAAPAVSIGGSFGAVAFVAVLVLLFWHGRSFSHRHGFDTGSHHDVQTVDLQGAKSAHARIEIGAGQLTINGGASHVLEADLRYSYSFADP